MNNSMNSMNSMNNHYSSIYKGNKLMYKGNNNARNVFNGKCICYSTHAEMDVLARLLKVAESTTF